MFCLKFETFHRAGKRKQKPGEGELIK